MDIDDILASVDRHDPSTPESTALDHQLLTRFWVAERGVSELLPWPGPLMDRLMDRVRRQIETIEDLAATSADPTTTKTPQSTTNTTINLTLSILQTDLARTQYTLRSLLRQRLAKLTKHSMHYLLRISPVPLTQSQSQSQSQSQDSADVRPEDSIPAPLHEGAHPPLSAPEVGFLQAHQHLLAKHYGDAFLGSFPPQLRRLDDNAGGTSMVQGPEVREVVFVRCLVEEVRVVVPPGDGVEEEVVGGTAMRMGDVWAVRWEGVRDAWGRGEVEVL
ncbi:hypothetical protein BO86DRAFT_358916 [Aspergillus japonicus CBS 114.51]|uniref:DNA replication complex GINS protein SLD5 n=2 Tax=Aspergillus TaxID=5052 RepID=A0A2V5H8T5_ASPV1|nr:hypothetical protein BO86DRAFT_358916 [Aspergillus japonicus CBS 114.51]PYI19971.1 hypothetical protein BO99DRAFT_481488 [Aspergillus violaceofuscus CBS 115571]RAH83635.1 hypothetical protein BO86DRAFT_358916 [Aspergillus japonicus CBS 114.51]